MLNYSLMNSDQPLNTSLQPASLSREMLLEAVASWHLPQQDFEAGTSPSVEHITNDSRKVTSGSLFVAIPGAELDGWQFVPKALTAGAKYIVGEHVLSQEEKALFEQVDASYIAVSSAHEALAALAQALWHYPSKHLRLVGVTGTNGKTSTATMLHRLFERLGYKSGLIGTVENRIGNEVIPATHTTPDPIALAQLLYRMQQAGCSHVFMEVSSHAAHQRRIGSLDFAGGLFTNLTRDHLDYHKTVENYLRAKKRFFDRLPAEAFALTNADDKSGAVMLQNTAARKLTYSLRTVADFKGKIVETHFEGTELLLDGRDVTVAFVGRFNAYNLLAVYGTAVALGEDAEQVLVALSSLRPVAGRFETITSPEGFTAIVDYAHTPDALANVLTSIHEVLRGTGRVITVVGAGGNRDTGKRPLMAREADRQSDQLILTSDNPRFEDPDAIIREMEAGLDTAAQVRVLCITDRLSAIKTACRLARRGDVVLVAGKGHEDYQEVRGVKHPFDDREVLRTLFSTSKA